MAHTAQGARARPTVTTRRDLSFIVWRDHYIRSHWDAPHDPQALHAQGHKIGRAFFAEVVQLAAVNPDAAQRAIVGALNDHGWKTGAWGVEEGFSAALAEYALIGMLAARQEVRHAA